MIKDSAKFINDVKDKNNMKIQQIVMRNRDYSSKVIENRENLNFDIVKET